VQQLNNQLNSFLCSSTNDFENRLLPNDLIVIRNQIVDHGGCKEHKGRAGEPRGVNIKLQSEPKSTSSPTWSLGPVCIQIDAQDASDRRFGPCAH
jgi:hypothetical protein